MAKKTAIDRAIEDLMKKQDEARGRASQEVAALQSAIDAMAAQRKTRKPKTAKARGVEAAA